MRCAQFAEQESGNFGVRPKRILIFRAQLPTDKGKSRKFSTQDSRMVRIPAERIGRIRSTPRAENCDRFAPAPGAYASGTEAATAPWGARKRRSGSPTTPSETRAPRKGRRPTSRREACRGAETDFRSSFDWKKCAGGGGHDASVLQEESAGVHRILVQDSES